MEPPVERIKHCNVSSSHHELVIKYNASNGTIKKMWRKYVEKSRPATFDMASKRGADSIPVEEKDVRFFYEVV